MPLEIERIYPTSLNREQLFKRNMEIVRYSIDVAYHQPRNVIPLRSDIFINAYIDDWQNSQQYLNDLPEAYKEEGERIYSMVRSEIVSNINWGIDIGQTIRSTEGYLSNYEHHSTPIAIQGTYDRIIYEFWLKEDLIQKELNRLALESIEGEEYKKLGEDMNTLREQFDKDLRPKGHEPMLSIGVNPDFSPSLEADKIPSILHGSLNYYVPMPPHRLLNSITKENFLIPLTRRVVQLARRNELFHILTGGRERVTLDYNRRTSFNTKSGN